MKTLLEKFASAVATWFGLGYLPKMPGTWGSLGALPLAWWVWEMPGVAAWPFVFGFVGLASWAAEVHDEKCGGHDTQSIVSDEVAGILIAAAFAQHSIAQYAAVFLLFRLFDIWKPWPARWIDEKVEGGWGVVLDDVVAGVYAMLLIGAWNRFFG